MDLAELGEQRICVGVVQYAQRFDLIIRGITHDVVAARTWSLAVVSHGRISQKMRGRAPWKRLLGASARRECAREDDRAIRCRCYLGHRRLNRSRRRLSSGQTSRGRKNRASIRANELLFRVLSACIFTC
jgi:hypothetical protein